MEVGHINLLYYEEAERLTSVLLQVKRTNKTKDRGTSGRKGGDL